MIHPIGDLPLSSRHRVSQISFHPIQRCLAVQSHARSVEIFRIRTEVEIKKKQARRKKRAKEKKVASQLVENGKESADEEMNVDSDAEPSLVDLFSPHLVVRASGKIRSFDFGSDTNDHKDGTQVSEVARIRDIFDDS
jgi:U3 small nucleolar RNA-associated protein 12